MDNPFEEMRSAVMRARELNRAVDDQANSMVDLLEGRLVHVSTYRLKKLKRQLQDFNANTGKWKQET